MHPLRSSSKLLILNFQLQPQPQFTMFSRTAPRFLRYATRSSLRTNATRQSVALRTIAVTSARQFSSCPVSAKGLQPDSEDPRPPNPQSPIAGAANHVTEPTPLTPEEYYEYSEHYFNYLVQQLEKAQEEGTDIEAEYSVCYSPSFLKYN